MSSAMTILLTFDVEEFDLPLEYNIPITEKEQMRVGKAGLDEIEKVLVEQHINSTLFTTANFALQYPQQIKKLSDSNEIASHCFYHGSFKKEDLLNSRVALEEICKKDIEGVRMPRFRPVDIGWLKEAGYKYDSSVNPTYIPGKYNNRHLPRTVYVEKDMIRVPVSVSPNFRFPLFWLSFKNIPYGVFKKLALRTLKKDGYLSLYFHPWEFTDLSSYSVPFYVKKNSGPRLLDRLHLLITDLKKEGEFISMSSFIKN